MAKTADCVVIGAGVIGCAVAWDLARQGLNVQVLERARIGRESSWAAAGVLAPNWNPRRGPTPPPTDQPPAASQGAINRDAQLLRLCRASAEMYPAWIQELHDRTSVGLDYHLTGTLHVWSSPEEAAAEKTWVESQPESIDRPQLLTPAEARRLEPQLASDVAGATLYPTDCQVANARLAPTLAQAASRHGAFFRTHEAVVGFEQTGGRITAVRTTKDRYSSATVILAGGAWTGLLAERLGLHVGVGPRKGQFLMTEVPGRLIRHVITAGETILVPRPHGPMLIGTTIEDAGFDKQVTLAAIEGILRRACRLVPVLERLPLVRAWAGLRPATPDGYPLLGPTPEPENLVLATGHFRKGILLAPVTGALIADLIASGKPPELMSAFLPRAVN